MLNADNHSTNPSYHHSENRGNGLGLEDEFAFKFVHPSELEIFVLDLVVVLVDAEFDRSTLFH
jgi:hypothetical protein